MNRIRAFYDSNVPLVKIPRAVDATSFVPHQTREAIRSQFSTPISTKVVLCVSSLSSEKRIDRLLQIVYEQLQDQTDLRIWIVGDGPMRKSLMETSKQMGISQKVQFLGMQKEMASVYNAADLNVLTSDTEGVPGVILEAALLAVPTVATSVGGIPDCLIDGETGRLVDPSNQIQFGNEVRILLNDARLRAEMGRKAKEWVKANFSLQNATNAYVDFYQKVYQQKYQTKTTPITKHMLRNS